MSNFTASAVWLKMLGDLIDHDEWVAPREQRCLEKIGYSTRVDMNHPVVMVTSRGLGFKFMAAEAHWILSGDNRVETIAPYSKKIVEFSDDGKTFFGAYGPKFRDQLPYIIKKLVEDPDTRQAVMTIWRENPPRTKDTPCTMAIQWFIRDGHLHCIDTMRSSDVWLGWPYDIFNFTMASWLIKLMLHEQGVEVDLGHLWLNAGSQHLYERNFEDAADLLVNPICFQGEIALSNFTTINRPADLMNLLQMTKNEKTGVLSWLK